MYSYLCTRTCIYYCTFYEHCKCNRRVVIKINYFAFNLFIMDPLFYALYTATSPFTQRLINHYKKNLTLFHIETTLLLKNQAKARKTTWS